MVSHFKSSSSCCGCFWYTGHGYPNGDLCIETQENPDGEHLRIEEILDLMIQTVTRNSPFIDSFNRNQPIINIFIDACYSGQNIERAKQYLLDKKPRQLIYIYCSSGPKYPSIVVPGIGSLLIAKYRQYENPRIKENRDELALKFETKKPARL